MHEIHRQVLVPLPTLLGVDLSITNEVLLLWLAAAVTFVALYLLARRRHAVATGPLENAMEAMVEFIEREVVRGTVGDGGPAWAPLLLALFFFILFGNLLGMVPLPDHFKAATANINVTLGLALVVFAVTLWINVRRHGLLGFLGKFTPSSVPRWLWVMITPIEVVTWLMRPLSLAIRLFANMVAGHTVLFVFIGMAASGALLLKPLPLVGAVVMSAFEIFVAFIQAFIFTMLAGLYIRDAIDAH